MYHSRKLLGIRRRERRQESHYPVTLNFMNWVFPKKDIPKPWKSHEHVAYASDPVDSETANAHIEPCIISGNGNAVDCAHVIPRICKRWYIENNMHRYITGAKGSKPFDSYHNTFPLRPDIHRQFDYSHLTLVPKRDESNSYKLAIHVLMPPGRSNNFDLQVIEQYHNHVCRAIKGVPPEYLFVRFAWSLFNSMVLVLFLRDNGIIFNVGLVETNRITGSRESVAQMMDKDIPQPRTGSSLTEPRPTESRGTKRGRNELEKQDDNNDTHSFSSFDPDAYDAALDVHSNGTWVGTGINDTDDIDSCSSSGIECGHPQKRPRFVSREKATKVQDSNKNDTHEWVKDQKG
ncbi:hypothetical protein F4814DRAFT_404152 [Daldinia grandis]|nr:hypothetical protein F4814DRAFT_404152 [Daldinia grandis]